MITQERAKQFAEEWIAAWNSHDLERILTHYTEDLTIESPVAETLLPETGGMIAGKKAVADYWKIGLQKSPNLHFELHDVLVGINSVTLYYTNAGNGRKTAEVMFLNGQNKVTRMFAHYSWPA